VNPEMEQRVKHLIESEKIPQCKVAHSLVLVAILFSAFVSV